MASSDSSGEVDLSAGVLCAGNIVYDILVRPVEEIRWGSTTWVERIEPHLGGNGASTAVTLGRLKVPVRLLGAVGPDPFGRSALDILREAGCDTGRVTKASSQTATSVALVNAAGARSFQHCPGASREVFLAPIPFHADLIAKHKHFHLANIFGLPGLRAHGGETLRRAKAAGLSTSLDTGWDSKGEWMTVLGPCLPHLNLLFVNEDEGRMLTGSGDPATVAAFFMERGVRTVVVKLGSNGCAVFGSDPSVNIPAFWVDVMDTTGAGDCFVGGFLAGLHAGFDLTGAARWGNAAGALNVTSLGGSTGIPSRDEFLKFLDSNEVSQATELK